MRREIRQELHDNAHQQGVDLKRHSELVAALSGGPDGEPPVDGAALVEAFNELGTVEDRLAELRARHTVLMKELFSDDSRRP
jgi:hypothetical protein